jgi:hypothetical protein
MAVDPTTFTELVAEVTTYAATYDIVIMAGALLGLIAFGAKRLMKAGR